MSENLLTSDVLSEIELTADYFLCNDKYEELEEFFHFHLESEYIFDSLDIEARLYYTLGNCAQALYKYSQLDWFSEDLGKAVIYFRKALYVIKKINSPTTTELILKSLIETNLGNTLSSQGRVFCAIPMWDSALKYKDINPVPIISKANNSLFIASSIYDPSHSEYYYFTAYQLINEGIKHLDNLYPEQKIAYEPSGNLMQFKSWFEEMFNIQEFSYFESYKQSCESRKKSDYLKWCGDNKLFLNDLNDVSTSEIVYQDIISLPPFSQIINSTLTMHEELVYHGNYDELKNDYCYARYLCFSAKDIPNYQNHFFNDTYPHVDDMTGSINNLKSNHYKSAFRILYSLFDKIAYFIHRFFDLNNISNDKHISFEKLFRKLGDRKWKPNVKLKDSKNYFIHALFYILKDMRDAGDNSKNDGLDLDPRSSCLDPDSQSFYKIRNAMEHRSLTIVDDLSYEIAQSDNLYKQSVYTKLKKEITEYQERSEILSKEIISAKKGKNQDLIIKLESEKKILDKSLTLAKEKEKEKEKLSSHSLIITMSEFESTLMVLMKLTRNSIMYLSLAIQKEEEDKPKDDIIIVSNHVPLK